MCTFKDIQDANKQIVTTDVKGKAYAEVNQRIKAFRMIHPNGGIHTEIVKLEDGLCVMKALITNEEGNVIGTGTAYEKESSSFINKTSYIENCETSAVGRALAMCGFGIDTSIASAEEVTNAIENQEKAEQKKPAKTTKKNDAVAEAELRAKVLKYVNNHLDADQQEQLCKAYKVDKLTNLTEQQCLHYKNFLEKQGAILD